MNKELRDDTYTMTGFLPSGNPFLWYYDDNKHTSFATSNQTRFWKKEPKVGDEVRMVTDGWNNAGWIYSAIYINDELVYKHSDELEKKQEEFTDGLYADLKKQKGFS